MKVRYRFVVALVAALLGMGWSFGTTTAHAATMGTSATHMTMGQHPGGGGKDFSERRGNDCCHGDHSAERHGERFHEERFHEERHDCCHDEHFHEDHCCNNGDEFNGESECDWLRDHDRDRWWRDCER